MGNLIKIELTKFIKKKDVIIISAIISLIPLLIALLTKLDISGLSIGGSFTSTEYVFSIWEMLRALIVLYIIPIYIPFFSKILYGSIPTPGTMVLFCLLLGIFALGAPGVPGGTVMASLGLITGVLGFNETGTALMLTIFALQDSFGTACNVTGDGALTLILTGYAKRHHIEEQNISVDL